MTRQFAGRSSPTNCPDWPRAGTAWAPGSDPQKVREGREIPLGARTVGRVHADETIDLHVGEPDLQVGTILQQRTSLLAVRLPLRIAVIRISTSDWQLISSAKEVATRRLKEEGPAPTMVQGELVSSRVLRYP